jgi:hypothetical protein
MSERVQFPNPHQIHMCCLQAKTIIVNLRVQVRALRA